jgi:CHAT domain-containing protein
VQRHLDLLARRLRSRLVRLHALLWAPLVPALAGARRVLVVPHGPLGAVPFAALTADEGEHGMPLGQTVELALAPSARAALRGLLRPPLAPCRALALGESSRLPHTAREASFVAGLFDHGQALVGDQATLQRLRSLAPEADVLHLACHAQFRSDNPRFSALHLRDAALSVDLAEALGLRACTVVLSACETGQAESGGGDEMVGLVRAFLVAGASRVLASQWPVDDAVTVGFMAAFYGALVRGAAPAAALQSAQSVTRLTHPHPWFWAAFTLYGGW